jgi:hypothetical protein
MLVEIEALGPDGFQGFLISGWGNASGGGRSWREHDRRLLPGHLNADWLISIAPRVFATAR